MTNDNSIVNMVSFGNLFFKGWRQRAARKDFQKLFRKVCVKIMLNFDNKI